MTTKIGLDLGYANITLSNITADVHREPSVVLVDDSSRKILSVGNKANLADSAEEWREVPEDGDPSMRFFKVEVEMP